MGPREIHLGIMSIRHADLPERVAAAAQAGFDGIALRADRWAETLRSGWSGPHIHLQHQFTLRADLAFRFH